MSLSRGHDLSSAMCICWREIYSGGPKHCTAREPLRLELGIAGHVWDVDRAQVQ